MSEREQATVAAWVIEDFTVERVIFGAGVTRISTEMGGDDPAAAVIASPVDQPGDTTLRKGVFRLWQGLAEAMQAVRSDTKGSDLASADQPSPSFIDQP